jgi:hypothetical protein
MQTHLQGNGKATRIAVVGRYGESGMGSAKKSKRELAAEKKASEEELDAVDPARVTDQHLDR